MDAAQSFKLARFTLIKVKQRGAAINIDRSVAYPLVTSHLRLVAKIAMGYSGY